MKKLLLIDGMAAVYRAYYALNRNPRVNSKGMNTSCVLGFTTTLYDLLRSQRPTHVGVAFDLQAPTFRHEMYAEYKANRDAMPEEIQAGLPWVKKMIEAFRIPILTCEGYEADDVIGTVSHAAEEAGFDEVVMVTPDKDFAQLVTGRVKMYRFGRMGKPDSVMGVAEVKEKFDVEDCRQVIDLLGLWGDASDNIPGIPGVGEKTAKKLIAQFGSIERMVEYADEIKNEKLRNLVKEHSEKALFSKQLATIRLDAPIAFDEESLLLREPDYGMLRELTDYLEFGPSSGPTLFDQMAPQAAPEVKHGQLTAEVLESLKGKDVAVVVSGADVVLSTDADSVWQSKVGDLPLEAFRTVMEDEKTVKLCYDLKNLKYILAELEVEPKGEVFDVQLAHYLLDAEMRHTMEFICSAMLGFEPQDAYAQAAALWQLYPLMVAALKDGGMESLYHEVELPLVDVLIDMEKEGVRIDVAALKEYSSQLAVEREEMERKIYELADEEFNISSPKQLGVILFEKMKLPHGKKTKTGYSTSADVLEKLADEFPFVNQILKYRQVTKLRSTYAEGLVNYIEEDGRIHGTFNQTITATGRISSTDPNLQNIPIRNELGQEIRKAFVAKEGCVFLDADYSQIELRLLAHLSGDENLIESYKSDSDIHKITASKVFHVPLDEVTKEQRRNAKAVNFGIVYGISSFGFRPVL